MPPVKKRVRAAGGPTGGDNAAGGSAATGAVGAAVDVDERTLPSAGQPRQYLGVGSQLSKYWNIYWRLISSLSIGKIYGILLSGLSIDRDS